MTNTVREVTNRIRRTTGTTTLGGYTPTRGVFWSRSRPTARPYGSSMLHPLPTSFPRPLLSCPASSPRVLLSRAVSPARVPLSRPASSPVPIMARSELFGRLDQQSSGFFALHKCPTAKVGHLCSPAQSRTARSRQEPLVQRKGEYLSFPSSKVSFRSFRFLESASPLANSSILRRFRCRRLREPL